MKVAILHLDLGIGGAEQLIVNMATVIKELGHEVTILTSHHDPSHCFEETKPNGHLGSSIHVHGDFIPRQIFGKATAFCAILRMLYLAVVMLLFCDADVVLLDGVSAPIPLLRLFGAKIIFYCHFPDMLLCYERTSPLKRFYRHFIDSVEQYTTGAAHLVLLNSHFTSHIYSQTFPALALHPPRQVLYPVVKEVEVGLSASEVGLLTPYCTRCRVFLSLNRFERKKNVQLAIEAFALMLRRMGPGGAGIGGGGGDAGDVGDTGDGDTKKTDRDTGDTWTWTGGGDTGTDRPLLVVAGGYDTRVDENVQYLQELRGVCERLGLRHATLQEGGVNRVGGVDVVFRRSIPSPERTALLMQTVALLYTPDREHFGIVPIEGMLLGVPVIAVNSGGPRETVVHGKTGYLCKQDAGEFADAMLLLLLAQTQGQAQGQREGERGGELGRTRSSRVKSASERGGTGTGGTGVVGVGVSMGEAARSHVRANFSYHSMRNSVQGILQQFAAEHLHLPNT